MGDLELKQRWGAFKFYCIAILLFLAVGYGGYSAGNWQSEKQQQQISGLQNTIDEFNRENNRLTRKVNILGVELEIEKRANQQAQQDLEHAFSENQQVRNELSFYQKVMAPELSKEGFVIDSMNFQSTSVERHFRYSLILMQQERRKNFVKGTVTVKLQGNLNGQMQELDLLALQESKKTTLGFHFRYFETLNGEVDLPEHFIPEKIMIKARMTHQGSKNATFERTFDWSEMLDQASEE